MSQQLVKKGTNGKMVHVNPKSWIEAIKDKSTGQTLVEILQGFNMYFLPYNGNTSSTRCLVPTMLRKKGLWITYVKYDGNVYTEWYDANEIDDKSWGDSSNWRVGNNTLVGDITISANGNWVINGIETEFKAVGEKGNTPLLRVANNRLQVSYDLGDTYIDVTNNPVYTKFRWLATTGDTQANNVGRIQASTDEGKTWTNMSNDFTNNLHIKKYIGVNESLPTSGIAEGTIYAKGPYYAEGDTLNENPIYRMWVYAWKGNTLAWQDNGEFTSIAAGVVQETGFSETEVMSQKSVTKSIVEISSFITNLDNISSYWYRILARIKKISIWTKEDIDIYLGFFGVYTRNDNVLFTIQIWTDGNRMIEELTIPYVSGFYEYKGELPHHNAYAEFIFDLTDLDWHMSSAETATQPKLIKIGLMSEREKVKIDTLEVNTEDSLRRIVPRVGSLFTPYEKTALIGKYIEPNQGYIGSNSAFVTSPFIDVVPGDIITFKGIDHLYGGYYNKDKNFILGFKYEGLITSPRTFKVPENVYYIRFSTKYDSYFKNGIYLNSNVFLNESINANIKDGQGIKYSVIKVKLDGSGDFSTISAAFSSIKDSSYDNRYIVEFYGDGTEYDTLKDYPYTAGNQGLFVPPFTKLIGIGGKEKCILTRRIETPDVAHCIFNLYGTSELENLTIIGKNTRYVIHDDFYQQQELDLHNYERVIKNCDIISEGTYYERCWGAGSRSGFRWRFENVNFKNSGGANDNSFSSHNNINFTNPSYITFVNCRFKARKDDTFRLGSLNTNANSINNYVVLQGCDVDRIILMEENRNLHGAGILYKLSGFGNTIKNGGNIHISNTDGMDYSDNVDLI